MEKYEIHPESPQARFIVKAGEKLKKDAIAIYPTDTVYGVGCCASNIKKIKEIAKILHRDEESLFSFICSDISQVSEYAEISTHNFKLLKKYLPGPYTFILPSTQLVYKKLAQKRKTVGIRIPDFEITRELVSEVGEPIANMSLNISGELRGDPELFITPDVINGVDIMVDCGILDNSKGTTIVDLTTNTPEVIRWGKGEWDE